MQMAMLSGGWQMYCVGMRIAITALATLVGVKSARAGFCDDLQAALALSAKFGKLRGAANSYDVWASSITIAGAQSCNILADDTRHAKHVVYSLYCSMHKLSSEREGATEFATLVSEIKKCAPQPNFSYRTKKTTSTLSFILERDHRMRGHLTVIRLPSAAPSDRLAPDRLAPDKPAHDNYWLELAIIGQ
jgi:hypothetical protein